MRRPSLRGYLRQHPAVTLTVVYLALAYWVARSIQQLLAARVTVQGNWAVTVLAGAAASLGLLGAVAGLLWWAVRNKTTGRGAAASVVAVVSLPLVLAAGMVYTRTAVMPQVGPPERVTTTIQLGAIAFMVPQYCLLGVFVGWVFAKNARNRRELTATGWATPAGPRGDLLVAHISPAADGWSVTWERAGNTPRPFRAPTLTAAAERAAAAVTSRWWHNHPPSPGTEFRIAISPARYRRGPVLEITGGPGAFTATGSGNGATIHAATLEALVTAARSACGPDSGDFLLQWTRPITALPPPAGASGHPPLQPPDPAAPG